MYPYFLFVAIHHLKSSSTFSVRPCSSVGRVTVDLFRRSWVRFPPRSKDFFFSSCGSLFPFTRANAQWVIHGFKWHFNLHFRVNSLFHYLCSQYYAAQHLHVLYWPVGIVSPLPYWNSNRARRHVGIVTVQLDYSLKGVLRASLPL